MRAEQPALQERDGPVAAPQCVPGAPLRLGLHDHIVGPLAEALAVVAGKPIRHHVRAVARAQAGLPPQRASIQ